ncbi:MAG TPA: hypothetical protein VF306_20910 [Pirellulales bacterium]
MDFSRHPLLLRGLTFASRVRRAAWRRRRAVKELALERTLFYRRVWHEAADALGASIAAVGDEIFEIRLGDWRTKVQRNYTAADDAVTLELVGQKPLVLELLARQGLPVPRWQEFTTASLEVAAAFIERVGGDCVVKPARDTGGGDGVTTHVRTRWQLARAAARAAVFGEALSIEEQVAGDNYRLLYLDGVLLDAVVRRPPSVTGDGRSTVAALVERLNDVRVTWGSEAAQSLLARDQDMLQTLAAQGLALGSVPAAGRLVRLKTVINDNSANDNAAATHLLCSEVIEAGAAAAAAVGARLAGVDIITTDPARPLAATGGVMLEVNTTPGFYYHYCRQGAPCPVALHVLNYLRNLPQQRSADLVDSLR